MNLVNELLSEGWEPDILADVISSLPEPVVEALHRQLDADAGTRSITVPDTPLDQALQRDPTYRPRPHLRYLSDRLAQAVADVEAGHNRYMTISMPPRTGKSRLTSIDFPTWVLRKHPDWKLGAISHSDTLSISWTRDVRRTFEENPEMGVTLARDAGAAGLWQTTKRGGMTARSAPGQSIIGLGFKVLILDDVVRDFASAHNSKARQRLWDWWRLDALSRLEPPYLVIAIGTRWHEDDLIGRLLSPDYEGNPEEWEQITFPAIATTSDVLGRAPGEPLLSPLIDETAEEALARWATTEASVGSYAWASMYQQRPAPAQGAIFNVDDWRYWTTDPDLVTDDGTTVLLPPDVMNVARITDSWDATFGGGDNADWVVGQRWASLGTRRFLLDQQRGRWTFTQTLARMKAQDWLDPRVATILVEKAANGAAILDTLKDQISGLRPVIPKGSKELRARAITAEVESHEVYLPHPTQFTWVADLLAELRDFPHAAHDDQVDSLTQYLLHARTATGGSVQTPTGRAPVVARTRRTGPRVPDRLTAVRRR